MRTNPYSHLNSFMEFLKMDRPESILDISTGSAKMGFVARDVLHFSDTNAGTVEETKIRIECITTDPALVQHYHHSIYDHVHVGDVHEIIDRLGVYDMVVVNGALEHMPKADGQAFLFSCMQHSNRNVAVFLPLQNGTNQHHTTGSAQGTHQVGWQKNELAPLSCSHHIQSDETGSYGAFLLSKEAFIDHHIEKLNHVSFQLGDVAPLDIRLRYQLDREHVGRVDLRRFDEHVIDVEHRNYFFDINFKEHYRLIAHLSTLYQGQTIFDIGTNRGYSALALSFNRDNNVVSYDLVECKQIGHAQKLHNIEYRLGDVRNDPRLLDAPLIMLDTNHDGEFESEFYTYLKNNQYKGLLFLDDIHLNEPMKQFWASIQEPKEDVTDLGHWSGSGVVVFD